MKKKQTKPGLFWVAICLLLIPGLIHAYLLMPFPGSQNLEAITASYYLEKIVFPLRIVGLLLLVVYLFGYFTKNSLGGKIVKAIVLLLCLASYYVTDVKYKAETMFREPSVIQFADAAHNKVPANFVILGVVNHGVAKAFPLIYLGYHHKVQADVGGMPVLVTYCSMCRTGRVFSPMVNGKKQTFRLVGARHYNAIIEDADTKSWWYQANGVAAVGKLKGHQLKEIYYEQASLAEWLNKYPNSLILQPDEHYKSDYDDLKNYDRLQAVDKDSTLKNKDTLIRKTWVIGVTAGNKAKAYQWRPMIKKRLLNDQLANTPLLVGIEKDSITFHVWNRQVAGTTLHFMLDPGGNLTDQETASVWNWDGRCILGKQKGYQLGKIQASQEYWHSWQHFHPGTLLQ